MNYSYTLVFKYKLFTYIYGSFDNICKWIIDEQQAFYEKCIVWEKKYINHVYYFPPAESGCRLKPANLPEKHQNHTLFPSHRSSHHLNSSFISTFMVWFVVEEI